MSRLWRRDVPLSERLRLGVGVGEEYPLGGAPGPPPTMDSPGPNISWFPETPLLTLDQPTFLMTPAAQAVSGFFVWTALLFTCHQVIKYTLHTHTQIHTSPRLKTHSIH